MFGRGWGLNESSGPVKFYEKIRFKSSIHMRHENTP